MVNLPAVLIANGLCVALMLVVIFSNSHNMRSVFFDDRLFYYMCHLTLLLSVLETVGFLVDGKIYPGSNLMNVVANSIVFAGNGLFVMIWFQYVEYKLFGRCLELRLPDVLYVLPLLVVIVMSLMNLFTPVFFYVDEYNVYHRLPLATLSYVVTYGYLLFTMVVAVRNARKAGRYMFLPVIVFMLPIFAGSLVQLLYYGVALIWVSVAFGLTSLYISIQNESSLLDSLTKLYNREFLTRYISSVEQRKLPGQMLGGIMIDINSFKEINDSYGHREGDKALQEMAGILMKASRSNDFVARYGGDEFVVLRTMESPRELEPLIENIERGVARHNHAAENPRYELTISMGCGVMDPNHDTTEDFIRLIDRRMYEQKELFHQRKLVP